MKKMTLLLVTMLAFTIANAQEKTTIKVKELQKAITQHISKNYKGYKTIEANKINTKGVTSYEVIVEKKPKKLDLYYDKDGKFLRKEVEKKTTSAKTTPSKTKTVPKTNNTNKSNTIKQDTLKKK